MLQKIFITLNIILVSSNMLHATLVTLYILLLQVVFVGTITVETVTGNSVFRKMDLQGIAEAAGICLAAVSCAAIFACFSSARNRVGRIFTIGCNSFIDNLIDQIVDGLFYESELGDWSDDV